MKQLLQFSFILCASLIIQSCKGHQPESQTATSEDTAVVETIYDFDDSELIKNIKTLSEDRFEGRRTDTEGGKMARAYVIEAFKSRDVNPLDESFEQAFSFTRREKDYNGTNVLGLIEGSVHKDKYIVISAHYDHVGINDGKIFNGADDDASGTSALFAFAEYFKANPPKHNVILAAFDAEELGLKGAYHFVDNSIVPKDQLVLNLNMDMVSRSEKNELFAVGTRYYPQLKPVIENYKRSGDVKVLIGHEGLDKAQDWTNSSDHAAFHKAEIPFVYFGVPDHEDYHKPTDDFENIDQTFYKNAVQTIINTFKAFDNLEL
ncbi:M28 family peptidase [Winogradskyella maritima]|uniref:M28 family peptidase n=1 Tax=Winogradskyella maritima TaxID=1517766 RepID=A0ABV8AIC2_9FLAO|nr:M28 family peptidase [Winogradskyella maritima]